MKLAWILQGFIVVLLVVAVTSRPLDCIDFLVVFTRLLALEVITTISTPVPIFSVILIVITTTVTVVDSPTVLVVVVTIWGVVESQSSSHIFPY